MLNICVGYDQRETVAYHVLCHSILRRATGPVSFIPVAKHLLPMFHRGMEDGSTEFSFSRFLAPHLCQFSQKLIFMDCDMLCRCNIYELLPFLPWDKDVAVVQHDYTPKTQTKFLGAAQHVYPKKNWSSLMVLNGYRLRCKLRPDYVNSATGGQLHQFEWADDVAEIPVEYNHLVGEYKPNPEAKIVHFTLGTPCFDEYKDCEFADEWRAERELMLGYHGGSKECYLTNTKPSKLSYMKTLIMGRRACSTRG